MKKWLLALTLALFSAEEPWVIIALMAFTTVPAYCEIRSRRL